MRNSKDNIFTGDTNQGNPYIGDFERGINYDSYEASFFLIDQVGNFPQLSQVYKTGSKRLRPRRACVLYRPGFVRRLATILS